MAAELGLTALILALMISIYQSIFPMLGVYRGDSRLANSARSAAIVQFLLVATSFAFLTYVHAVSDFSVKNVVENSHSAKPFIYKLTGVWGNHEGSMLLWVLILTAYGGALALSGKPGKISTLSARTLGIQGLISAAFIAFLLFTSNPFERIIPSPPDGMDLNPLLQDPGLIIHPPFLYLGYVGFSITFSYAVAGLLQGRIDADWARIVRPWALSAWVFLTIGIALGSWWAYYELGWGGFWAWDPVENASFMPWLAGVALIHSIRVVENRKTLKAWTVLLAISAFSLSLIGTFLVRSGILTSVHAFAVDPTRGVFILAILGLVIGGSLLVYALRAGTLSSEGAFAPVSRESAILFNNVLIMTACATVFIGTFYPLFIDVISGERLSVGAPYFNATFLPLMALLLVVIAPGAAMAWKKGSMTTLKRLWPVALVAMVSMAIALWLSWPKTVAAALGAGLAVWAGGGAIYDLLNRIKAFSSNPGTIWARLTGLPRAYLGMTIAHVGLAIVVLGVLGAGVWRSEHIQFMTPGDSIMIGGFTLQLTGVSQEQGPNFVSESARFAIERKDKAVRTMVAERRFYPVRRMQTTEAAIWTTLKGDLYISVGERTTEAGWPVRVYYNPLVFWLWAGAGIMALGGITAATRRPASTRNHEEKFETASAKAQ